MAAGTVSDSMKSSLRSLGRRARGEDDDTTIIRQRGPGLPQNVRPSGYSSKQNAEPNRQARHEFNDPRPSLQKTDSGLNKVQSEFTEAISSQGSALWNRVTVTASKLTVNVSQAWHKTIRPDEGEETPQGGESHLTKAMKAYHLSRAKTPADLPAWLFTERERGIGSSSWKTSGSSYEDRFRPEAQTPTRSTGLREIYSSNSNPPPVRSSPAADRLRAIREAKRAAVSTPSQSKTDTGNIVASTNRGLASDYKDPRSRLAPE